MAEPRKNPFGKRKDTGIGYDGTRTNNPFATPTKSPRRRDQWELANQARNIFEMKKDAQKRAQEARERAEQARQEADQKRWDEREQGRIADKQGWNKDHIKSWSKDKNNQWIPTFKQDADWESQGIFIDDEGLATERLRHKHGKTKDVDPARQNSSGDYLSEHIKEDSKTGDKYVTIKETGERYRIASNIKKRMQDRVDQAVEEAQVERLNRQSKVDDTQNKIARQRAKIGKQNRLIDHRKKTSPDYYISGDDHQDQSLAYREDYNSLNNLEEELENLESSKQAYTESVQDQDKYINWIKTSPTWYQWHDVFSRRNYDESLKEQVELRGPGGKLYTDPDQTPVHTPDGTLQVKPSGDTSEEAINIHAVGEAIAQGTSAINNYIKILSDLALDNPKDEEIQQRYEDAKTKKQSRNPIISNEIVETVGVKVLPSSDLRKALEQIDILTDTSKGPAKLKKGVAEYDGTNISVAQKILQEEAKELATKAVYDQLLADVNGNAEKAKLVAFCLQGKDLDSIYSFGGEAKKIRPQTYKAQEVVLTTDAFKLLHDSPEKLTKKQKSLIVKRLEEHGFATEDSGSIEGQSAWFDNTIDIPAYQNAKKSLEDNWKAEVEYMETAWQHFEVDARTGLGFSFRRAPGNKGKPIFQYKIDDALGDGSVIKEKAYSSWKDDEGGLVEDHLDFVSRHLAVTRKDKGFLKDTSNRFRKTLARGMESLVFAPYRLFGSKEKAAHIEKVKKELNKIYDEEFSVSVASDFKARTSKWLRRWHGVADGAAQLFLFATGARYAGWAGGMATNYSMQTESMITEAADSGMSPKGTIGLYTTAAGIAAIDTLSDRFMLSGGSVIRKALPALAYKKLVSTTGGRIAAGFAGMMSKAGTEGATESVQTFWENVYAKSVYDHERGLGEDVADSFWIGAFIGGAMGVRSFGSDLLDSIQNATELKSIEEGLDKVEKAANGGETIKEELSDISGQEVDDVDIHDAHSVLQDTHSQTAAKVLNFPNVKTALANVLADPSKGLSEENQEAILQSATEGGEALFSSIGIGKNYAQNFPILTIKERDQLIQAMELTNEVLPGQLDAAISAIEGYIFTAREAQSILDNGKATQDEYVDALIDMGLARKDSDGALKVNASAARMLPRSLAERIREEAQETKTSTNVEPAMSGETNTDSAIDSLNEEGKEVVSEVADERINSQPTTFNVDISSQSDPDTVHTLPVEASTPEVAEDIARNRAEVAFGISDPVVNVQLPELKPGKKVETEEEVTQEEVAQEETPEDLQKRQVAEEEEVAQEDFQKQAQEQIDEMGEKRPPATGEFGTGKPGTGEFGQDKPTGQDRSGAVDIKDDQQIPQKGQPDVQEDTDPFPGSEESVRERKEEKEEEPIQEEDAPSEVLTPPETFIKDFFGRVKESVSEIEGNISNVKSGPIKDGVETFTFDYEGDSFEGRQEGRLRDVVVGTSTDNDAQIAALAMVDGLVERTGKSSTQKTPAPSEVLDKPSKWDPYKHKMTEHPDWKYGGPEVRRNIRSEWAKANASKTSPEISEAFQADAFITAIIDAGGILSKTGAITKWGARKVKKNADLWEGPPSLAHPTHNVIYDPDGMAPDEMAREVAMFLKDATVDELYSKIEQTSRSAVSILKQQKEEIQRQDEEIQRLNEEEIKEREKAVAELPPPPKALSTPAEEQIEIVKAFNKKNPSKIDLIPIDLDTASDRVDVDLFQAIEAATGRRIILTEPMPFTKGGSFSGAKVDPNTIIINVDGFYSAQAVLGHEFLHTVKDQDPKLYKDFVKAIKKASKYYPEIISKVNIELYLQEEYKSEEELWDTLEEEAIANIAGDLFVDPKFWDVFYKRNASLSDKIIQAFHDFIEKLGNKIKGVKDPVTWNTSKALTDLDAVRNAFATLINESSGSKRYKNLPGRKVNDNFALDPQQQFFNFESKPARDKVKQVNKKIPKNKQLKDFGQKIGGARKDLWANYKDKITLELGDDANITLSKHFPEPNYKALIKAGANVDALATVRALRDMIPPKPTGSSWRQKSRLKKWTETFKTVRILASHIVNNPSEASLQVIDELIRQDLTADDKLINGYSGVLSDTSKLSRQLKLYRALGFPAFTEIKGWSTELYKSVHHDENGLPLDSPKQALVARLKGRYTVRSPKSFKKDINEAIEDIAEQLKKIIADPNNKRAGKRTAKPLIDRYGIYRDTRTRDIFIARKIGRNTVRLKEGFDTAEQARSYLADNLEAIDKDFEDRKNVQVRGEENRPRAGEGLRKPDEDIDPERFTSRFRFRGVEFGNYVGGARRQRDLNNAYDSLNDLADVINIPAEAVSLNGTLGLAFGARGHGGANAALAHYEPIKVAINLTKKRGAGSLGHEWFHGLDNYFQRLNRKGKADTTPVGDLMTERQRVPEKARPEMVQAFNDLRDALSKGDFTRRAKVLDEVRASPYWNTPEEKAARAFETYLVDRLEEKGITNDYLANIRRESGAYPTKAEMDAGISEAFDNLFKSIQYKPTERGTMMFALDPETDSKYLELAKNPKKNNTALRSMVDSAAKMAGYPTKAFHGGAKGIKEFKNPELGFHFAKDRRISEVRDGAQMYEVYLPSLNDFYNVGTDLGDFSDMEMLKEILQDDQEGSIGLPIPYGKFDEFQSPEDVVKFLESQGWKGMTYEATFEARDADISEELAESYVVFDNKDIKSADPVTYDDQGNITPLSERFGESSDIRFALDPETDEPFYSGVVKGIQDKFPNKASKDQAHAFFKPGKTPGVKSAEVDYMGINEFLDDHFAKGNKTITKKELEEFAEANQFILEIDDSAKQWESLTQKGGENYRILQFRKPKSGEEWDYTGGHFSPNTAFHVRIKDRKGPNGEKILFIEEIQSDWAQAEAQRQRIRGIFDEDSEISSQAIINQEELEDLKTKVNEFQDEYERVVLSEMDEHSEEFKAHDRLLKTIQSQLDIKAKELLKRIIDNKEKIIKDYEIVRDTILKKTDDFGALWAPYSLEDLGLTEEPMAYYANIYDSIESAFVGMNQQVEERLFDSREVQDSLHTLDDEGRALESARRLMRYSSEQPHQDSLRESFYKVAKANTVDDEKTYGLFNIPLKTKELVEKFERERHPFLSGETLDYMSLTPGSWKINNTVLDIFQEFQDTRWIDELLSEAQGGTQGGTQGGKRFLTRQLAPAPRLIGENLQNIEVDISNLPNYEGSADLMSIVDSWKVSDQRLRLLEREVQSRKGEAKGAMPLSKTYHEAALKYLVRLAVKNGYDQLAWATGSQQIDLYTETLRQNVNSIEWDMNVGGGQNWDQGTEFAPEGFPRPEDIQSFDVMVRAEPKDKPGTLEDVGIFPLRGKGGDQNKSLDDVMGKKMADRVRAEVDEKIQNNLKPEEYKGKIEEDDLSIGGHFHRLMYDQMVPSFLTGKKGYLKKFGAKVENKPTLFEEPATLPDDLLKEISKQMDGYDHEHLYNEMHGAFSSVQKELQDFQDYLASHTFPLLSGGNPSLEKLGTRKFIDTIHSLADGFNNIFKVYRKNTPDYLQFIHGFDQTYEVPPGQEPPQMAPDIPDDGTGITVNAALAGTGVSTNRTNRTRRYRGGEHFLDDLHYDVIDNSSISSYYTPRNKLALYEYTFGDRDIIKFLDPRRSDAMWTRVSLLRDNDVADYEASLGKQDTIFRREQKTGNDLNDFKPEHLNEVKNFWQKHGINVLDGYLTLLDRFNEEDFYWDQLLVADTVTARLQEQATGGYKYPTAPTIVFTPEMKQSQELQDQPSTFALDPVDGKKLASVKGLNQFTQAMDRAPSEAVLGAYEHIPVTDDNTEKIYALADKVEQILQPTTEENPYAREAQSNAAGLVAGMIRNGEPKQLVEDLISERRRLENYQGHPDLKAIIDDIAYEEAVMQVPQVKEHTKRQKNFIKLWNKHKSKPESSYAKASAKALEKDFGKDWKDIAEGTDIQVIPSPKFALDPVGAEARVPSRLISSATATDVHNPANSVDYKEVEPGKARQTINAIKRKARQRHKDTGKIWPSFLDWRVKKGLNAEEQQEEFIEHLKNNLLWLHNKFPEKLRSRAKKWYDGAHKLSLKWAERYGVPARSVAAVIASLSPQRNWFTNVSLAERVLDIVVEHRNKKWTPEMEKSLRKILSSKKKSEVDERVNAIKGKTFAQVWNKRSTLETAKSKKDAVGDYIRAFDETYFGKELAQTTPEGEFLGKWSDDVQWGSNEFIFKAVSVLVDPSHENISQKLGGYHKIRSFYNNIIAPLYGDDVTIDTHAVAAAHLRPLSGASTEVKLNFNETVPDVKGVRGSVIKGGASSSAVTGIQGSYPLYAEAYRRAAREVKGGPILPREMQSIAWEAIRSLYGDSVKKSINKMDEIEGIWYDYQNGKYTQGPTRSRAFRAAGGFTDPAWSRQDQLVDEDFGDSTYISKLPRTRLLGQELPKRTSKRRGRGHDPVSDKPGIRGLKFALDPENVSRDYEEKKAQRDRASELLGDVSKKEKEAKKEERKKTKPQRFGLFNYLTKGQYDLMDLASGTHGGTGTAGETLREAEFNTAKTKAAVKEYSDLLSREIKMRVGVPLWRLIKRAKRISKFTRDMHVTASRLNAVKVDPETQEFIFQGFDVRMGFLTMDEAKAKGAMPGDYIRLGGQTLKVGQYVDELEGYVLLQHFTAGDQAKLYSEFLNEYPDLGIFLQRWIHPELASLRWTASNNVKTPIFNRHSLREVFQETEYGDPGFVEGYTPDIAAMTILGGAFLKSKAFLTNTKQQRELGALFARRANKARALKTGTARERGFAIDMFKGFNIRAFEAHQESISRENAFNLLKAATKDIPEDGTIPKDHTQISKATLNDIIKGMVVTMGRESAKGSSLHKIWQKAVDHAGQVEYLQPALFDVNNENFDERELKVIDFLFGDSNAIRYVGNNVMMDNRSYSKLQDNFASRNHNELLENAANMIAGAMKPMIGGFLTLPGTILMNWIAPNLQSFSGSLMRLNKAAIYASTGALNKEDRARAEYELRAALENLKGLATRRASNFKGIDWFLTGEERMTGQLSQKDYDKGTWKLIKEGQIGKAIKVATDRRRYYGEVVPRELFDNNTLISAITSTDPEDSVMKDLLNLNAPGAILRVAKFHEMDPTVKQNMVYSSYKAHAQMAYKKAVKEAKAKGQKIDTSKKNWMRNWMKNVRKTNPEIHKEAMATAMLFAFDYSNIPMWLGSNHPGMVAAKPTIFTFGNFMYNYLKLLYNLSPLGAGIKLAKSKGKKDALGGAEWRNATSTLALWGLATVIYQNLLGDDEEDKPLVAGKLGTSTSVLGDMQKFFWTQTGGKINLEALPDWIGNSIRAYLSAYGADDADNYELWLRGRSLPYINILATQSLWMDQGKKGTTNLDTAILESIEMAREFTPSGPLLQLLVGSKYTSNQNITQRGANLFYDLTTSRIVPGPYRRLGAKLSDPYARRRYSNETLEYNTNEFSKFWNEIKMSTPDIWPFKSMSSETLPVHGRLKRRKLKKTKDGKIPTLEQAMGQKADVDEDIKQLIAMEINPENNVRIKEKKGEIWITYPTPEAVRETPWSEELMSSSIRVEGKKTIERAIGEAGVEDYRDINNLIERAGENQEKIEDLKDDEQKSLSAWTAYTTSREYRDAIRNMTLRDMSKAAKLQKTNGTEIQGLPKDAKPDFLSKVIDLAERDQFGNIINRADKRPIDLNMYKKWELVPLDSRNENPGTNPRAYRIKNKTKSTKIPYFPFKKKRAK